MKTSVLDFEVIPGGNVDRTGPFTAADYVQLAAWGGRSVVLRIGGAHPGEIVIRSGLPWWAGDDQGEGIDAFYRLIQAGGLESDDPVSCRILGGESRPRNVQGSAEALLLEAAQELDHRHRDDSPAVTVLPKRRPSSPGVSTAKQFVALVDAGVDALLGKDYPRACAAFLAASKLKPTDPTVRANLERLRMLGFNPESPS